MGFLLSLCITFLLHRNLNAAESEPRCITLGRLLPCNPLQKYRTMDGTCNNLLFPVWGKAFWPYRRLLPDSYSDGRYKFPTSISGKPYKSARVISNVLFKPKDLKDEMFTLAHMQMGQMITHDMALADGTQVPKGNQPPPGCCDSGNMYGKDSNTSLCSDIDIPPEDPDYSAEHFQCLQFARTTTTEKYGCGLENKALEQITTVTSYLDLSNVYGNSEKESRSIRTLSGGKLKAVIREGQEWPPNLADPEQECARSTAGEDICYSGGDVRMNQNPQLTVLQIVFFRYHNKLAPALAELNPTWDDEKIYQETRRILGAIFQKIAYSEILVNYIGEEAMLSNGLLYPNAKGCVDDYDPFSSATVRQEFATAAWRRFHSQIADNLSAYNTQREVTEVVNLSDWIDRGGIMERSQEVNYNTLLRGMTIENAHKVGYYAHDIKCRFAKNDTTNLGTDLISVDIQRARDHGLPKYVVVRKYCNLTVPKTFDDLSPDISPEDIEKLKQLYEKVEDIEYYPAADLENRIPGTLSGPTFQCIIIKQFKLTRIGDRFFYQNCEKNGFTTEQLASLQSVTLARVLCDNSDLEEVQEYATKLPSESNPVKRCADLPYLDITLWKSEGSKEKPSSYTEAVLKFFAKVKEFFQQYKLK